jgi:hypothetical protein
MSKARELLGRMHYLPPFGMTGLLAFVVAFTHGETYSVGPPAIAHGEVPVTDSAAPRPLPLSPANCAVERAVPAYTPGSFWVSIATYGPGVDGEGDNTVTTIAYRDTRHPDAQPHPQPAQRAITDGPHSYGLYGTFVPVATGEVSEFELFANGVLCTGTVRADAQKGLSVTVV